MSTTPRFRPGDRVRTLPTDDEMPSGSLGTIAEHYPSKPGFLEGYGVRLDDDPTGLVAHYDPHEIAPAHLTQDDARAALEALTPALIEHVVNPAFAYLQDRLAEYEEAPLWGRDTAMVTATIALAIHAYRETTRSELETDTGPDEWDMSRAEHEADKLRDRIAGLEIERRRTARDLELLVDAYAHLLLDRARLQALADRRWVAWQSARRRARQQRVAQGDAMVADRARARRARDRYRDERNDARAQLADLRAQLAATTAPHRAEDRLAADAHPGTDRSTT